MQQPKVNFPRDDWGQGQVIKVLQGTCPEPTLEDQCTKSLQGYSSPCFEKWRGLEPEAREARWSELTQNAFWAI